MKDQLEKKASELRKQIKVLEIELMDVNEEINVIDRREREERRQSREQRQWLNEFTARQAHYHSR